MSTLLPSGRCADSMSSLDRVMSLAYEYGYRVGLQLGAHGRVVIHVRDIEGDNKVIAVISDTIENAANVLFDRILKSGYVPRSRFSGVG